MGNKKIDKIFTYYLINNINNKNMDEQDIINMLTPKLIKNIKRLNTNIYTHDEHTIINILNECYDSFGKILAKIHESNYLHAFTKQIDSISDNELMIEARNIFY